MSPEKLRELELADGILNAPILRIAHKSLIVEWGRLARLEQRRLEGHR